MGDILYLSAWPIWSRIRNCRTYSIHMHIQIHYFVLIKMKYVVL